MADPAHYANLLRASMRELELAFLVRPAAMDSEERKGGKPKTRVAAAKRKKATAKKPRASSKAKAPVKASKNRKPAAAKKTQQPQP